MGVFALERRGTPSFTRLPREAFANVPRLLEIVKLYE